MALPWPFLIGPFNLSLSVGHDHRAAVSSLSSALQPNLAAVNHHHHRLNSTSSPPRTGRIRSQKGRTERQGREESPKRIQITGYRSKGRRIKQRSHSLPRNIHGHSDVEDFNEPTARGRHRQRETRKETGSRSKSEERMRQPKNEREEETQEEEGQSDREWEKNKLDVSIHKQLDPTTRPHVVMSCQSNHPCAHESHLSPFSFLLSNTQSQNLK